MQTLTLGEECFASRVIHAWTQPALVALDSGSDRTTGAIHLKL